MKQKTFEEIIWKVLNFISEHSDSLDESIVTITEIFNSEDHYQNILHLLKIERLLTPWSTLSKVLLVERLLSIQKVLSSKGEEYGSVDRLHNFKSSSRTARVTMLQCAKMFQLKHLVSIDDLLTKRLTCTREVVDEKVGDAINYEILMLAIKEEECL